MSSEYKCHNHHFKTDIFFHPPRSNLRLLLDIPKLCSVWSRFKNCFNKSGQHNGHFGKDGHFGKAKKVLGSTVILTRPKSDGWASTLDEKNVLT